MYKYIIDVTNSYFFQQKTKMLTKFDRAFYVLFTLCSISEAKRIASSMDLASNKLLYTTKTNSNPIEVFWNNDFFLEVLHKSCVIEISKRGIRYIEPSYFRDCENVFEYNKWNKPKNALYDASQCIPEKNVLCWFKNNQGGFFPSSNNEKRLIESTGTINPLFNLSTLNVFYRHSHVSCGNNKNPNNPATFVNRIIQNASIHVPRYVVSACDIMESDKVLTYFPLTNDILVYNETFGPIAYFGVLILLLILVHATYNTLYEEAKPILLFLYIVLNIGLSITIVIFQHIHRIAFLTFEDEFFFWFSFSVSFIYSMLFFFYSNETKTKICSNACIFIIMGLLCAIHRSAENGYSLITIFLLALQLSKKLFEELKIVFFNNEKQLEVKMSILQFACKEFIHVIDYLVLSFGLSLNIEISLKEQFSSYSSCLIYIEIGSLITYAISIYSFKEKNINLIFEKSSSNGK